MIGRTKKNLVKCFLPLLLFMQLGVYGQANKFARAANLYSCLKEYKIECPKTCLAIAIYETGWMGCHNCSGQFNNLFGFRNTHTYIKFKNVYECLEYLKKWQIDFYDPWKRKHPNETYYEFLVHIKYTGSNMTNYLANIKSIERLLAKETRAIDKAELPAPANKTKAK